MLKAILRAMAGKGRQSVDIPKKTSQKERIFTVCKDTMQLTIVNDTYDYNTTISEKLR